MLKNFKWAMRIALLSALFFSCNQNYPNLLENVGNDSIEVHGNTPKVLYIMLTGARGKAIQNATTPTLTQLAKHSIYTFDGVADYEKAFDTFTVANGWANMLTGVTQTKSKTDTIWSENKLAEFPTFISRLKTLEPDWNTVAFTSSDDLKSKFLTDATTSKSFGGNDQATMQAALKGLKSNENAKVMITQLSGVQQAGEQYGFSDSISEFKNAIETADQEVGKLLDALKSRKNYNHEKWLVVIASGNGGGPVVEQEKGLTAYDDMERNTFIMFYNPKFQNYYIPKPNNTSGAGPFKGETVKLWGDPGSDGVNAVVEAADQSIYDPKQGAMTMEAKVKFFPRDGDSYGYSYPPFISKTERTGSTAGWCLYRSGNAVTAYVADGTSKIEIKGGDVANSDWHTFALVIWKDGDNVNVKFFIDNVLIGYNSQSYDPGASIESNHKLTFGFNPQVFSSQTINMEIQDVRIWDVALPDDIIKEYSCLPGFPPATHPYISDLVGFWACNDGSGNAFVNQVDTTYNAILKTGGSGKAEWTPFNDVSNNVCPEPAATYYQMVPNSVDIPFEIYQWLGVTVSSDWQLDGRGWVTGYTDVRNPIL